MSTFFLLQNRGKTRCIRQSVLDAHAFGHHAFGHLGSRKQTGSSREGQQACKDIRGNRDSGLRRKQAVQAFVQADHPVRCVPGNPSITQPAIDVQRIKPMLQIILKISHATCLKQTFCLLNRFSVQCTLERLRGEVSAYWPLRPCASIFYNRKGSARPL